MELPLISTIGFTGDSHCTLRSSDPPTSTEPPTPTPTPPAPTPATACALPWTGPNYNVDSNGLDVTTASIDTSCVGDVTISFTLAHLGSMEMTGFTKDTLQIFYTIDNTPETLWLDIAGDQYSTSNQVTVASGASLSIRVQGGTTAGDEFCLIRTNRSGLRLFR